MLKRLLTLPKNRSFFLFGARNTGKSTLIESQFPKDQCLWLDFLDSKVEARFSRNPEELFNIVTNLPKNITHIVMDEIQKIPKLLDVVHRLMKDKERKFVMTGSSARKLKQGGANLLAGRAFVYDLFPFTSVELQEKFKLEDALCWGTLPEVVTYQDDVDRREFLNAYANTYLKEEIWGEHLIRHLDPFRRFLEVAAQTNGQVVNYSNIARDTQSSDKTVKFYFNILEDTLVGFFLDAYHDSIRKSLSSKPKFYFFDTGVVRSLANTLDIPLRPGTNSYGRAFEHFIITEVVRLNSYLRKNYKLSYLRTASGNEIDLIIERPGQTRLLIEIKSATEVHQQMIGPFKRLSADIPNSEAICLSNDPYVKKFEHVLVLPWKQGLEKIFDL